MGEKLKVLYVGKYPPYVGGETTKAYWLLRALAEKGHKIFVLTDTWELPYYWSAKLTINDIAMIQPKNIKLFSTTFHDISNFIPPYNPKTEKLVSMGIELVESFGKPDVILSWYLVPFSTAAHVLSLKYKIPHVVHHAGSDIYRLLFTSFLQDYLLEVLTTANGIITYFSTFEIMSKLNKNLLPHKYPLNPEPYYNATRIQVKGHILKLVEDYALDDEWRTINTDKLERCIENHNKLVAIPGKWNKSKGIYSWLNIIREIEDICFIFVGDSPSPLHEKVTSEIKVSKNGVWIPFIPTWRMPELYESVDAVGHLEIRFPIPNHFSMLSLESLLGGRKFITNLRERVDNCNTKIVNLDEKDNIIRDSFQHALSEQSECQVNIEEHISHWRMWVDTMENFILNIATK